MAQQIDVKDLITYYDSLRSDIITAYDKAIALRRNMYGEPKDSLDEVIHHISNAASTLRGMAF